MGIMKISERQKNILQWIGIILLVIGVLTIAYMKETMFRPKSMEDYHSSMAQVDCLLCGTSNDYRGADMLALIKFNNNKFELSNVGLKEYCSSDSWEMDGGYHMCDTLMYEDDGLSENELQHKYSPFDINGKYRLHNNWEFGMEMFASPFDKNGTTGTIYRYEANQFVYGRLDMGFPCRADANYLTSLLCQPCFEKVYPATRNINCFFYDCQTGTVYPLLGSESEYDVRDYAVDLVYSSSSNVVFVIKYKEAK